jgi:hypothetical protein
MNDNTNKLRLEELVNSLTSKDFRCVDSAFQSAFLETDNSSRLSRPATSNDLLLMLESSYARTTAFNILEKALAHETGKSGNDQRKALRESLPSLDPQKLFPSLLKDFESMVQKRTNSHSLPRLWLSTFHVALN